MTEALKNLIINEPEARERANKNKVIAKVIYEGYALAHNPVKPRMTDIAGEILTLDRAWRLFLRDNKEYRGKDYNEKAELEVEKQRELGYNV